MKGNEPTVKLRAAWQALRSLVGAGRRTLEQLLHPARRRLARDRLARTAAPSSVLVVCLGNICRSPYAAALLRQALNQRSGAPPRIDSAGFLVQGRPVPAVGQQVAARRGVDLSAHRSQIVTSVALQATDLIVVMDGEQERAVRMLLAGAPRAVVVLGDLDPQPIETRAVRDPIGQAEAVFEQSYARIERCVAELVAVIGAGREAGNERRHIGPVP